jgi:hypothetical protein
MIVTQDKPKFRPVTVRIETQDELDMLLAVISNVAENRINPIPQVIVAAKDLRVSIFDIINSED